MVATNNMGQGDNFGWYCDLNRSGATLAWDFLFPGESRPALLGHIEDRDLWRFKLDGTREINSYVFAHEHSFEEWDKLMAADAIELMKMHRAGYVLDKKHKKDLRETISHCVRRMVIAGYDVPVAGLPGFMASDGAGQLAVGEPFAASYVDTAESRVFSLRSSPDGLDVSAIAKLFGGGGHEHASGFSVPRSHPLAQL